VIVVQASRVSLCLHSFPSASDKLLLLLIVAVEKWLACQSMDNQIIIFGVQNRFRLNRKKAFKGHMVAGYACQVNFSPDGR
jgi:hypothetical protein